MEPRGAGIILCSSRTKIVPRPLRHASCRAVAQSNPFRQLPLMLQRRSSLWLLYGPVAHFPASPGPPSAAAAFVWPLWAVLVHRSRRGHIGSSAPPAVHLLRHGLVWPFWAGLWSGGVVSQMCQTWG